MFVGPGVEVKPVVGEHAADLHFAQLAPDVAGEVRDRHAQVRGGVWLAQVARGHSASTMMPAHSPPLTPSASAQVRWWMVHAA